MSDHLVEVPKEGWGSWKESVERSGVRFSDKQFRLGEELVARTEFPVKNRILQVRDYCSVSSVTHLFHRMSRFDITEPVHPLLLLELARGIEGAVDSSIFDHMQYPMAMSPFLLTDAKGGNFILLLENDRNRFSGRFKSLAEDDYLPRCTHVWGYVSEMEPDHEKPVHTFRLREDGKYGPFVS